MLKLVGPTVNLAEASRRVVVVGASAVGFFTAALLARAGRSVEVLEQSERLNPAPRTLIVTSRLRDLLGPAAQASVVNEILRFELFTDGRAATVPLSRPDLIIERTSLIRGLAEQAQHAGAQMEFGRRFLGLEGNDRGLWLNVERGRDGGREQIYAGTVIGADGAVSRVAQAAGWPRQETVSLVQAIVPLSKGYPQNTVRVWFVPDDTPYFYWLIPESSTRGALGLIGEDGQQIRRHLKSFLEKHGFTALSFQGARIPLYSRWVPVERQMGAGRVYLVGDAAGQVKVTTVGGIVTGFRGALGVSESILNGGRSGELRALRRELDLHLLIRRVLYGFKQADYCRLVDLLNGPTRHLLSVYTRDEVAQLLWQVAIHQPRLLLLGLRSLLAKGLFCRRESA